MKRGQSRMAQKTGQEPIAEWKEGWHALLVPDPFSEALFSQGFSNSLLPLVRGGSVDGGKAGFVSDSFQDPPVGVSFSAGRLMAKRFR